MPPKIDYTGQKYNRMTIISFSHSLNGHRYWKCECECGNYRTVQIRSVVVGNTKSCGCYNKEKVREAGKKNKTHGYSTSRFYKLWWSLIQRCTNKKSAMYKDYGAKGIKICDDWLKFENFLKDMGVRPSNLHTIGRIDNSKDYDTSNCKWVIDETKRGLIVEYKGTKKLLIDWSKELNIERSILYSRIFQMGWDIEKAFLTPVKKYKKG